MIKSFTVGVKHHVNLGNYESMEVEASVTMEVNVVDGILGDAMMAARDDAQEALSILQNDTFHAQKSPEWFSEIPMKKLRKQVTENTR